MPRLPAVFFALLLLATPGHAAETRPVTVFAAASLSDVMQKIGAAYAAERGKQIVFSFAASSALARQIEAATGGADIFISADQDWMDYLERKNFLAKASRRTIAGNRLVLIAPASSKTIIAPKAPLDLARLLGRGRLSLADPETVPAGKYAKAALTDLGAWDGVKARLVPAENVRVALSYVARGEAPLGIVYETDAKAEAKVRVAGVFPAASHPAIVYPLALTRDAKPGARDFADFLKGAKAARLFTAAGFTLPR